MKRILTTILAAFALTGGVIAQTIKDANVEIRAAKNFTVIKLSSSFDVYLTQSNEESVAVSAAEQKYMSDIKVEVKNGVLDIRYEPKGAKWNSGNKKLKAYISFKQLDKLEAGGACDVDIIGVWKAEFAKIQLSGASDLAGKLDLQKLSIDLSGASDIKVSGTVGALDIEASGASSFKGYELSTDYCNARASGASDIKILVNKELSVQASGASDVNYKGSGLIRDLKTSGASSVSRRS